MFHAIELGLTTVRYCKTAHMRAEFLTKALLGRQVPALARDELRAARRPRAPRTRWCVVPQQLAVHRVDRDGGHDRDHDPDDNQRDRRFPEGAAQDAPVVLGQPVWNSNFGRPTRRCPRNCIVDSTPSTRGCLHSCVCSKSLFGFHTAADAPTKDCTV